MLQKALFFASSKRPYPEQAKAEIGSRNGYLLRYYAWHYGRKYQSKRRSITASTKLSARDFYTVIDNPQHILLNPFMEMAFPLLAPNESKCLSVEAFSKL